ncbi:bifunctional ornithine acetyltransferase/N-acetylglutamate synthase [Bacillus aquiflavi]|uniref:Arginine biosynthesis bifunctional protein ArgJ n=1 Tax=Bacillus aquiflavi TaxID=2672567 RepID=A0A6B3VZS2_9BACI|nr:bifunctional ornithine acetyltransferase/N-acetylglutamate synthase [Bacillus aquiflavi]MBA4536476.1 bifunctional ornithine acetyltransferase/N-acetylglutamate synthase [Bacillus aquiflavi]NEY80844.1 bifunctional ornithine acetyltransferase/N-acetylglutamate synthase [Bacillus aquiflavi]
MQTLSGTDEIKEIENGGITTPLGFFAAGTHAGLRYSKKDLGIIYSDVSANSAAVYTVNHFQAPPLQVTQQSIEVEGKLQAIVVNSACANACTGERGYQDALKMRSLTAEKFNLKDHLVAVASTGVIGEFLPMEKIQSGIEQISVGQTIKHTEDFQTAILTTDTVMKSCCFSAEINGKKVTIGGAAKGSGMIHPNMATMLAFLTTDAAIPQPYLYSALKEVTDVTFNQITVDGDTSTNDMVIVMANGKAGNDLLTPEHPEWKVFKQLLKLCCEGLAKQVAKDGEGATKLIDVIVEGAATNEEARIVAKQVVGSNLVKTAVFGADANWGRIIGAIGQCPVSLNPQMVDIAIGSIQILKNSEPQLFSNEKATEYLKNDVINIFINLNNGVGKGQAWGCDLSYDYVKINANYRT